MQGKDVYVPIVAPDHEIDPSRDYELANDMAECLYSEGWSFTEVGEWAKACWTFSGLFLRTSLTVRKN